MKGIANVGDVLASKYRVDKILGIGGMGMVVAATNLMLDQRVALKFMLPQALESPEAGARFLREARAAGRLTSEHICRVIDVGRFDSGAPYIVMEYLEGYDLATLLKRKGPLRVAEAVDYVLQACEGMAEAHAVGIVHRDLKPDNLYLATRVDGRRVLKVLDFGISKANVTGIATKTGDILGSPAYMAPEQMKSTKDVDARADIWSLGAVLYQLLAGRMPFESDTLPALCLSVLNDDPEPLRSIRSDVPEGLSEAVMRCLAKSRDHRFADVSDLAAAIAPFGGSDSVGAATRVRGLLRGRATPTTLPPTADELADYQQGGGVAPTLVETAEDLAITQRPVHVRAEPAAMIKAKTTTFKNAAGESIAMPRARVPLGVLGAIVGAAGVVAVIVVMVMRSNTGSRTTTAPSAVVPAASEPVTPPAPPPTAEPIPAPAAPPSEPVKAEPPPPTPIVATPAEPPPEPTPSKRKRDRKPPIATVPKLDPAPAPAPPVDAGVAPEPEDKWGRMLHDKPPEKPKP